MAYQPKEGSGSLFKNNRKTSENHPDYTGSMMVAMVCEHWLSAWVKEGNSGKFFSVSLGKVKEPIGFKPRGEDEIQRNTLVDDTDIPF